jgi:NAD-dependent deacetylase
MSHGIETLKEYINNSHYIVAFTGAGISAESGIPTYRGSDGVWQKYDPAKFASIDYFHKDPSYYWSFFQEVRYPGLLKAKPNPAHYALAQLEKKGLVKSVITQNIDGLHRLAGSERVLELHGNTRRIVCLKCSRKYSMDQAYELLQSQIPPRCPECQGLLKPDVVLFGESLPLDVLDQAQEEANRCDLFLAIGSSLVVQPAASLPSIAKEAKSQLVIINMEPTCLDFKADLVIQGSAAETLQKVV